MTATIQRAGDAAVERLLDRLAELAAAEVPDVTAERVDGGLRLTGKRLGLRRLQDVRLRGLAFAAVRSAKR